MAARAQGADVDTVLGWGLRPTTQRARAYALRNKLPFVALEDGFLRSFRPGQSSPPLSIVVDTTGIYYDCHRPSDLETLLNSDAEVLNVDDCSAEDVRRARALIAQHHLSKYNHAPDFDPEVFERGAWSDVWRGRRKILVIDQTAGDMSTVYGGADGRRFEQMLAAARADHPEALVVVKTHPEVSSGAKRGYLSEVQDDDSTCVLRDSVNPIQLLQSVDAVYVVTSTMGFEALSLGQSVVTFGVPWYAGWGCTDDRATQYQDFSVPDPSLQHTSVRKMQAHLAPESDWRSRRTRTRTVDELFAAANFHYMRYINPLTHERGTVFDAIDWLLVQKNAVARFAQCAQAHTSQTAGRIYAVGFPQWRRFNVRPLLNALTSRFEFVRSAEQLQKVDVNAADQLIHWGKKIPAGLHQLAIQAGAQIWCMEDGFVRSVGLGSDLILPHSLVLDSRGIYFDPTAPSDLEHMLNFEAFSAEDVRRAQAVREFIVMHNISKYNIDRVQTPAWLSQAQGREVVFVPGQVEDDASIQYGCTTVKTNLDLLKSARAAHPEALIVYKPHPDVMAKNRIGNVGLEAAREYADVIETQTSVISCIQSCDVVHTMTSLTGFDALLRGKRVVVYGRPFYAGWGLTEDKGAEFPDGRRVSTLSLDELVAGALLRYPIYFDWELKGFTTCETTLNQLLAQRERLTASGRMERLRSGWARRQVRKLKVVANAFWAKV